MTLSTGQKKRHGTCRVFLLRSQDSNLELPDPESGALLDLTVKIVRY